MHGARVLAACRPNVRPVAVDQPAPLGGAIGVCLASTYSAPLREALVLSPGNLVVHGPLLVTDCTPSYGHERSFSFVYFCHWQFACLCGLCQSSRKREMLAAVEHQRRAGGPLL